VVWTYRSSECLLVPFLGNALRLPDGNTLVVYSGRNEDLVGPILEQFTEQTGIEIELRAGDSGELAAQLITEGDASPADLFFSQDAGALGAVAKAGLFSTLPSSGLDQVPTWAQSEDGSWVGVSGRVRVVAYHEETVTTPPDTIDALVDQMRVDVETIREKVTDYA